MRLQQRSLLTHEISLSLVSVSFNPPSILLPERFLKILLVLLLTVQNVHHDIQWPLSSSAYTCNLMFLYFPLLDDISVPFHWRFQPSFSFSCHSSRDQQSPPQWSLLWSSPLPWQLILFFAVLFLKLTFLSTLPYLFLFLSTCLPSGVLQSRI